jgi:hypothetical protein
LAQLGTWLSAEVSAGLKAEVIVSSSQDLSMWPGLLYIMAGFPGQRLKRKRQTDNQ